MLKRIFLGLAMTLMAQSLSAQEEENAPVRDPDNKYLVWTSNVKVVDPAYASHEDALRMSTAIGKAESFLESHFPYRSLCDWTPGMKFMVLPEKKDMVIRTFFDGETAKMVGNMSLRYKVFIYQGLERDDIHDKMLFQEEQTKHPYYFEVPTHLFEDFCFSRKGVPTLAYLGDVDSAMVHLVGKQLTTNYDQYNIDVTTTSYGYDKVPVKKGTVVTVKAVGVGSRNNPVKLIVEDESGHQFYQNVSISGTNSGMTEEEMNEKDEVKHTFNGSFRLLTDEPLMRANEYKEYVGKSVITLHATSMLNEYDVEEDVVRLSEFVVKNIMKIPGSDYVMIELDKNGQKFSKRVTFVRKTSITEDALLGARDDYFGTLFRVGSLNMEGVRAVNIEYIRQGVVQPGFTEEEVRLALGEPDAYGKSTRGTAYTWTYKSMIDREQFVVYFNKRTRLVTAIRQ